MMEAAPFAVKFQTAPSASVLVRVLGMALRLSQGASGAPGRGAGPVPVPVPAAFMMYTGECQRCGIDDEMSNASEW
jgi:hypothetical protein